jgi:hypothetical protein
VVRTDDGRWIAADLSVPGRLSALDLRPGNLLRGAIGFSAPRGNAIVSVSMQSPLRGPLATWQTRPATTPSAIPTQPAIVTSVPVSTPTASQLLTSEQVTSVMSSPVTTSLADYRPQPGQMCRPPADDHAVMADGVWLKCAAGERAAQWVRSVPVLGTATAGVPCDGGVEGLMVSPDGRDLVCGLDPSGAQTWQPMR